jgi:hypothetical protein
MRIKKSKLTSALIACAAAVVLGGVAGGAFAHDPKAVANNKKNEATTPNTKAAVADASVPYGVWCENQNCLDSTMLPHGLSQVNCGGFGASGVLVPSDWDHITGAPSPMNASDLLNIKQNSGATTVYVTVGGSNTGAAKDKTVWVNALVDLYQKGFTYDGLDFDLEGSFAPPITLADCASIANTVATKIGPGKKLKIQFTVQGKQDNVKPLGDAFNDLDQTKYPQISDYKLAIMLYGQSMYEPTPPPGWGLDCSTTPSTATTTGATIDTINKWRAKVKNPADIILGMTSNINSPGNYDECYIKTFEDQVTKNKLAGINVWQASVKLCDVINEVYSSCTFPSGHPGPTPTDTKLYIKNNTKAGTAFATCTPNGGKPYIIENGLTTPIPVTEGTTSVKCSASADGSTTATYTYTNATWTPTDTCQKIGDKWTCTFGGGSGPTGGCDAWSATHKYKVDDCVTASDENKYTCNPPGGQPYSAWCQEYDPAGKDSKLAWIQKTQD